MGNNVFRWNLKASSLAAFAFFNFCFWDWETGKCSQAEILSSERDENGG